MPDDPRLGTTLSGKYSIERVLGEGGMGVVYAARHLKLDRPVAIKFLHAAYAKDRAALDRFFVEARAAGSLRHPNVVDVSDLDTDGEAPFMVLELLEGESLAALLARRGRLPPDEALAIVLPVLDALAAAHERGIVHRDIKPDNVFLAREAGRVVPKLLDFGIAKLRDGSAAATRTGTAMGTPMYMSPEQARGEVREIGPETDVWAMGVLLFECLTGTWPFAVEPNAGVYAMIACVAAGTPRKLRDRMPEATDTLAAAVDGALATARSRRLPSALAMRATLLGEPLPPSAASLAPTLVATPGSLPLPATRVSMPGARVSAAWIAAASVAVVGLLAVLVAIGWAMRRPPATPAVTTRAPAPPSLVAPTTVAEPSPPETQVTATTTPAQAPAPPRTERRPVRPPETETPRAVEAPPSTAAQPSPTGHAAPPPATARAQTRTGTWNPDDL